MDFKAVEAIGAKSDMPPDLNLQSAERRPWSTPVVIVSEMRHAGAQVALGSDGTDNGYQYGS